MISSDQVEIKMFTYYDTAVFPHIYNQIFWFLFGRYNIAYS